MKILSLICLSFATAFLSVPAAQAHGFCNISETVYLQPLPFEIRDQVQSTKKYPVDTWKNCYKHGIDAAVSVAFNKTITLCQEGNCQDLTGPVFFSWYFWSDQSLVTVTGKVTQYTWQFDPSIQRDDRRFFPDGSMFP